MYMVCLEILGVVLISIKPVCNRKARGDTLFYAVMKVACEAMVSMQFKKMNRIDYSTRDVNLPGFWAPGFEQQPNCPLIVKTLSDLFNLFP